MRYNRHFKDNNWLTPTTYTQELSEYAADLKYEDLPPEVVERAKMILLHTVGASLAASSTPAAAKARQMAVEANGGEGGSTTVWGSGEKLSSVNSALVLGVLASALSWEDCAWTGHPAAGVIPCAWLAAEEKHKSGKDLIAGIVAAYEVYQRIAMAVQPSEEQWNAKGWGLTSWQIFGTVLAAAKLYGLDARKIDQAIAFACESSPLPTNYQDVTMSDFRPYEYGYRARDGFLVAKSVEKGVHNYRDTLDHDMSYALGACTGPDGSNEMDSSWLNKELGSRYFIMETMLKRWPTTVWAQAAAELAAGLSKEHGFGPDDVEEIAVTPSVGYRMWAPDDTFVSEAQAQRSIPFAIASVLCGTVPGAQWYEADRLGDEKILALAKRIKGGAESSLANNFKKFQAGDYPETTIHVTLKNGQTYTGAMTCPPGHPANMMSWEELAEQFRVQAASAMEGERLEKAIDLLCNIENVEDIAAVSELLK